MQLDLEEPDVRVRTYEIEVEVAKCSAHACDDLYRINFGYLYRVGFHTDPRDLKKNVAAIGLCDEEDSLLRRPQAL